MNDKIKYLKELLDNSHYTVALCGSGVVNENGIGVLKSREMSYELAEKYHAEPEYIFTSGYFHTRTQTFFDFYRDEMLSQIPDKLTSTGYVLAAMEKAGKLQCIISSNIYDIERRSGCQNVINLHGTLYENICPHCGKKYSYEYILSTKKVPICEKCSTVIRPQVALFGEMLDNQLMTHTTEEIEKAEILLLLGTTLDSEVYKQYITYFQGKTIITVHEHEHHSDLKANLVIYDQPHNVLSQLEYL